MGSVGDCFDNAMCEGFFATLECKLLNRRRFKTQVEAANGGLRFHRGLVQPSSPPFGSRLSLADQLRKEPFNSIPHKPNTVY